MRTLLVIAVLLACAAAASLEFQENPLSQEFIDHINNDIKPNWKAGRNFHPHEWERLKAISGCVAEGNGEYMKENMRVKDVVVRDDLPKEFDARKKWKECTSLREIRDQGDCGSCWAFSVAESITDRICINKKPPVRISSEDILSCCDWCGEGCKSGYPAKAWQYWTQTGVVTGGPYDSNQGCMPYTIPPAPGFNNVPTPPCTKKCIKSYNQTYTQDKRKGSSSYAVQGVKKIMQEIVDHGSVSAVFQLYTDFLNYKTGVYRQKTGYHIGGHCVKLIGYGNEGGDDYWLAANSWNKTWGGLGGFFKILKGKDECGIEDWIAGGTP